MSAHTRFSPEQAAIMDALADGAKTWEAVHLRVLSRPKVLCLATRLVRALDTLLASGHVIRRERECEVCHGKARVSREREHWDGEWITASEACLHCTDGKQTVYVPTGT
jgi:diadenosine tetraphosphatase ApaH/serine/threonine PP2A family protein phosphatase